MYIVHVYVYKLRIVLIKIFTQLFYSLFKCTTNSTLSIFFFAVNRGLTLRTKMMVHNVFMNQTAEAYSWIMAKGGTRHGVRKSEQFKYLHIDRICTDARTSSWPLIGSPFPMLTLILSYVYLVKVAGPQWMAHRKPFRIRKLIIAYNMSMVALSAFFFIYVNFMSKENVKGKSA